MLCDCDEYPFASTYEGAFQNRETTSAKYILSSDNRAVGSALSAFYSRQRVLDMSYETGGATSRTNPNGGFNRDSGGDVFWIHIMANRKQASLLTSAPSEPNDARH
ncbi:NucA/NucB deoxyribonuclease domain-containing protein [Cupriavidus nantongensis]|nr:NucA/NucB deoxyribonuclease domain-containing protein [Cupriavidus nantongensis]